MNLSNEEYELEHELEYEMEHVLNEIKQSEIEQSNYQTKIEDYKKSITNNTNT